MKKAVIAALSLIISAAMSVSGSASSVSIKLDGQNPGNEWFSYSDSYISLMNGNTSSDNINSAGVMYAVDTARSCVWYYFSYSCKKSPDDMSLSGIILTVEDCEPVTLLMGSSDESVTEYDSGSYDISLVMTKQRDNSVNCEVKAVIKDGIGESVVSTVQFIDNNGKSSVKKSISAGNPEYTTTEKATTTKVTTTKVTTTKTTTSKTTTTKTTTSKASKTSTAHSRTRRASTSYSSRVTTKAAKTTEKQTAEKTTRVTTAKAKTAKAKSAEASAKAEYVSSETESSSGSESSGSISATITEKDTASLTSVYKIAAGAGAVLLLAVTAIWTVRSHSEALKADKKEKESLPENTDEKREDKEDKE